MMDAAFIIYIATGFLFIGLAIPLIKRKIKRNSFYGVRLPETMKNDEIWYASNEYGGKLLLRLGIAVSTLGIILYISPLYSDVASFLFLNGLLLFGAIYIAVKAMTFSNRYSKNQKSNIEADLK